MAKTLLASSTPPPVNILLQTGALDTAPWAVSGATVVGQGAGTGPALDTGPTQAYLVTRSGVAGQFAHFYQKLTLAFGGSQPFDGSIYVMSANGLPLTFNLVLSDVIAHTYVQSVTAGAAWTRAEVEKVGPWTSGQIGVGIIFANLGDAVLLAAGQLTEGAAMLPYRPNGAVVLPGPSAFLSVAIQAIRRATTAPVSALARAAMKVVMAASSPLATLRTAYAAGLAAQAQTSPAATVQRQVGAHIAAASSAIAALVAAYLPSGLHLNVSTSPAASLITSLIRNLRRRLAGFIRRASH